MPTKDQLEEKIGQAYQVIGSLIHHIEEGETNISDGEFLRAQDYFAADKFDPEFLPWPKHR